MDRSALASHRSYDQKPAAATGQDAVAALSKEPQMFGIPLSAVLGVTGAGLILFARQATPETSLAMHIAGGVAGAGALYLLFKS